MLALGIIFVLLLIAGWLFYLGRGYWAWVLPGFCGLCLYGALRTRLGWPFWLVCGGFVILALFFGWPAIRRRFLTAWLMPHFARLIPKMGETERIALEAGTVWWEGELFSGDPNWSRLFAFSARPLAAEERAFLEGPVETLCTMANDWEIEQAHDLPQEIWDYIKHHRFFGLIIPKEYGGLEFSALAHSAIIAKLGSRSVAIAVTVMVPNSLGPAELLLRYGTEAQRRYYLPRLATGEEIPCFALTGPEAGSDAAATQSTGIVCYGHYAGERVLGLRLNWRKRYITLAPISTLIGLAFRLLDPERLLGGAHDRGITCALIPAHLPGIEIGARHDPLGVPFLNGPTNGHNVFVPLEFIIGGKEMAGQGWRMLMESLAAGRAISLPALSVGGAELALRIIGAYATVREQFDTPIGRFEGIEEPLSRIGGLTYLMNAARTLTAGAVDAGERPAVASAIVKSYLTESLRIVVNDAMDIRAGAAICRGPRNVLSRLYMTVPIGITVEGANILTRSMIIYGQGAIRCHPYVREEMAAIAKGDLLRFDRALFGHLNLLCKNAMRAFVLGLRSGRATGSFGANAVVAGYMREFSRMSAAFVLVSDMAMAMLGGKLKRHEKISGRLADILAFMYLGSAALKKFCDEEKNPLELPFVRWACTHALYQAETALIGVLGNLPTRASRLAGRLLRLLLLPFGPQLHPPDDRLGAEVARALLEDRQERLRLTQDIYMPKQREVGLGRLEAALSKAVQALAIESKLRDAVRAGRLDHAPGEALADLGLSAGIITAEERQRIREADEAREEVIQVDAFRGEFPR